MTKGEIIASVLKNLRDSLIDEVLRSSTSADDQQHVETYLDAVFQDAKPSANISTCADFSSLKLECCDTCHNFGYPFDMSPMVELKMGGHAWICCAIEMALGEDIAVKRRRTKNLVRSAEYKPFADFFGGKSQDNDVK